DRESLPRPDRPVVAAWERDLGQHRAPPVLLAPAGRTSRGERLRPGRPPAGGKLQGFPAPAADLERPAPQTQHAAPAAAIPAQLLRPDHRMGLDRRTSPSAG